MRVESVTSGDFDSGFCSRKAHIVTQFTNVWPIDLKENSVDLRTLEV